MTNAGLSVTLTLIVRGVVSLS